MGLWYHADGVPLSSAGRKVWAECRRCSPTGVRPAWTRMTAAHPARKRCRPYRFATDSRASVGPEGRTERFDPPPLGGRVLYRPLLTALPLWEGRYRGYGHHVQPCAAPLLAHGLFVIVGGNGALEVLLGRGPIVLGCDLLGVPAPPKPQRERGSGQRARWPGWLSSSTRAWARARRCRPA